MANGCVRRLGRSHSQSLRGRRRLLFRRPVISDDHDYGWVESDGPVPADPTPPIGTQTVSDVTTHVSPRRVPVVRVDKESVPERMRKEEVVFPEEVKVHEEYEGDPDEERPEGEEEEDTCILRFQSIAPVLSRPWTRPTTMGTSCGLVYRVGKESLSRGSPGGKEVRGFDLVPGSGENSSQSSSGPVYDESGKRAGGTSPLESFLDNFWDGTGVRCYGRLVDGVGEEHIEWFVWGSTGVEYSFTLGT